MSKQTGWLSFASKFYYLTGLAYYLYAFFFAGSGLSFIGAYIAAHFSTFDGWPSVLTGLGVGLFALGITYWRKLNGVKYRIRNPHLNIVAMKIHYKICNSTTCEYVRKITATCPQSVGHYTAKFYWTGNGQVTAEPLAGAGKIEISDDPQSHYKICRVHFTKTPRTGELVEFSYKLKLHDANNRIKPYLGIKPELAGSTLELSVTFPSDAAPTKYYRQILATPDAELPLYSEEIVLDDAWDGVAHWHTKVKSPYYYYRLLWE